MRIVTWTIRLVLFLLLVALAAKNIEPVTLRFYFDLAWQMPLVVLLFVFFAAGALFGVLALVVPLMRQRREISLLRKRIPPEEPGRAPVPEL
ncbi:MAG TPA: LapA family protein [Burkholderiales bacterium]|nr:LapA family protein [Burkholderiales bacterium]